MAPEGPSVQRLLGVGAVIAVVLVVAMALGWLVDSLLDTIPIFILVGLVLGSVAAVLYAKTTFSQYLEK